MRINTVVTCGAGYSYPFGKTSTSLGGVRDVQSLVFYIKEDFV